MTSKELVLKIHRDKGRADALALREKATAGTITDTEIIDSEEAVPAWSEKADYRGTPIGSPVTRGGQVYGLITQHRPADYLDNAEPGTDAGKTLWRIKHTTNPAKAKPWVPTDSVNLYYEGECMIWTDGKVKRAKRTTNYSPDEYAPDWEDVEVAV